MIDLYAGKTCVSDLYVMCSPKLPRIFATENKSEHIALTYPSQRFKLMICKMLRQSVRGHLLRGHPPEDVSAVNSGTNVGDVQRNSFLVDACACLVASFSQAAAIGAQSIKHFSLLHSPMNCLTRRQEFSQKNSDVCPAIMRV
jgi:hypothetical protein